MAATGSWIWKPWIKFAVPDLSVPKSNWCQFNADVFALAIFRFPDLCLQVCVPICQVDLSVRSCVFCAEIKHERFQMIEGITEEASYLRYNSWNLWVSKKVPAFKPWRLGLGQDFQVALGAKNIAELKDYSFPFYVIEKAKIPSLPIDVFHTVRSLLRAYVWIQRYLLYLWCASHLLGDL